MKDFESLVDALNDLKDRGFDHDFNVETDRIYCNRLKSYYTPKEFKVVEFYRFEGMSNPDDNSIVYGIETSNGDKGVLVDAYGAYESLSDEMVKKLSVKHS